MSGVHPTTIAESHEAAAAAADRARVTVRGLVDTVQFAAASALVASVWGTPIDASPLPSDLLASFAHGGSCLLGAYAGEDLVGMAVGLAGPPCSRQVYSIIAATSPAVAGRGVGGALKFAQRAWSLERGADRMTWTFDPLIRRNAHFNLNKLGVRASSYLPDFYPPMHDAINRQDLTDRIVAEWDLAGPSGRTPDAGEVIELVGCDGAQRPVRHDGDLDVDEADLLSVSVPADIEQMRRVDPNLAREWRLAVRDVLTPRLLQGYRIVGFTVAGSYILRRGAHD